jgi:HEAT repeat protein
VERFRLKAILKKHPYVSTLVVIVLAQWFFTVVLEYLFTYSVSLAASSSELVPAASGAVENVLVHEFGFLQIILAGAALISNLFFTGRMLSAFGVVGSILLHPLVSLLSLAAMVLHFGYFTTVVSRINAEVTGVVYRNAYQSTYYIFDEAESQFTRIFLDGVVRPVGSLVGTFFLLVSYFFVSPAYFITALLVGVFFVLLFFLLASMKLQKQHTHLVLSKLMSPSASRELRLSLLDVVAQNHFSLDAPYALDLYHSSQEFPLLRVKLLKLFSQRREHLDLIFESLNSESPEIRFAALDSLTLLLESGFFSEQLLSRRELISRLKKRYIDEQDSDLRFSLVILLAKMKDKPVLDFLLSLLETEQGDMLGNAILACDFYGDPSFTPFIEPFLASDDPRIWGNAAVVLGKHESYRSLIRKKLDSSLSLDTHAVRVTIPFVLGVLRDDTYSAHLLRRLDESNSPEEKLLATFALVQMGAPFALQHFIDQAFMSQFHEPSRIFRLLQAFSARERFVVEKIIQQRTMTELHHCFRKFSATRLDKLSRVDLQYLRKLYSFLHATESIAEIDEILSSKHGISRHDIRHFVSLPLTLSAYV